VRAHLQVANVGNVTAQQRTVTVLKIDDAYQAAGERICERRLTGGNLCSKRGGGVTQSNELRSRKDVQA
jgi:hypothetical protein